MEEAMVDNQNNQTQNEEASTSTSVSMPNSSRRKARTLQDLYSNTRRLDPKEYEDYVLYADADPIHYDDACQHKKWRDAMDNEINSVSLGTRP